MKSLCSKKSCTFRSLLILVSLLPTLSACTDRVYKQSLSGHWDCGTYQLSLEADGKYALAAPTLGQRYSGTYQINEALGGGHTIKWTGQPNAFTRENTFIQGPSSDRQMALGRDAGSTGTLCSKLKVR